MKNAFLFFVPVLWLCASCFASPPQNRDRDTAAVEQFISGQAARAGGEEYREARKVAAGDLNGDGLADLAVCYTIEGMGGSNNYVQYLAVFLRLKGRAVPVAHAPVGGKGDRSVELQSIRRGVILLSTLSGGGASAGGRGSVRFVLAGRALKEQRSAPRRSPRP
jgi:hypothetical protein